MAHVSRGMLLLGISILASLALAACAPAAPPAATTPPQQPTAAPARPTEAAPAKPATPAPAQATATSAPPAKPAATSAPPAKPAATATAVPKAAPPPAKPAASTAEATFQWVTNLTTTEEIDDIMVDLKKTAGILDGFGNETAITIRYEPQQITVDQIRRRLAEMGHPVRP